MDGVTAADFAHEAWHKIHRIARCLVMSMYQDLPVPYTSDSQARSSEG